jgi:hypothetical protein
MGLPSGKSKMIFKIAFTINVYRIVENALGYRNGDVVKHASGFPSDPHRLVLFHGGADENVHFAHTAALISRLVEVSCEILIAWFVSFHCKSHFSSGNLTSCNCIQRTDMEYPKELCILRSK